MISKTYRMPLPLHFGPATSRYHDVDQEPVVKRRRLLPDRFPCNAEHTIQAAATAPSPSDSPVAGLPQPRRQQAVGVAIDSAGSDWATRKTFVADTSRNPKNQARNVALELGDVWKLQTR
jgi:hypothetical protein